MKILVIRTAFIGDVVLATAVVEKLAAAFPEAEIHFLLSKGKEGLLAQNPLVRRVFIRKDQGRFGLFSFFDMLIQLRSERYDRVVNLQRLGSMSLLTCLLAAKETVGFRSAPFSLFYSKRLNLQVGNGMSESDRLQELIRHWTNDKVFRPAVFLPPTVEESIAVFKNRPYAVVAPCSQWATKEMPFRKWVSFLAMLPEDQKVYFIGSELESPRIDKLISSAGRGVNLAGNLSLLQAAALMKSALICFVNDSGPMHLAAAVNANVCAVFCSTSPSLGFLPQCDRFTVIEINERLSCRPCGTHGKKVCPEKHFHCGEKIDLDQMYHAFTESLAKK